MIDYFILLSTTINHMPLVDRLVGLVLRYSANIVLGLYSKPFPLRKIIYYYHYYCLIIYYLWLLHLYTRTLFWSVLTCYIGEFLWACYLYCRLWMVGLLVNVEWFSKERVCPNHVTVLKFTSRKWENPPVTSGWSGHLSRFERRTDLVLLVVL